jgi:hypothetical protein
VKLENHTKLVSQGVAVINVACGGKLCIVMHVCLLPYLLTYLTAAAAAAGGGAAAAAAGAAAAAAAAYHNISNIILHISKQGSQQQPAVLLVAHHDSPVGSPGERPSCVWPIYPV